MLFLAWQETFLETVIVNGLKLWVYKSTTLQTATLQNASRQPVFIYKTNS
jgi:hypothetical protein